MSGNNLRPLLPAPPGQRRIIDEDTVPARSKSRAPPVLAACSPCRTARTKCDGVRPSCGRCNTRGDTCAYDVDPNTTRMEGLKQKVTTLQFECNELHELYKYLRTKTEVEAIGILKRIRDTEDPLVVLNIIRDGTFCYNLQLCEKVPEVCLSPLLCVLLSLLAVLWELSPLLRLAGISCRMPLCVRYRRSSNLGRLLSPYQGKEICRPCTATHCDTSTQLFST